MNTTEFILLLTATFLAAFLFSFAVTPYSYDWENFWYPAVEYFLDDDLTIYDIKGFVNPPWSVWLVMPFYVFGLKDGMCVFFAASATIYVAFSVKARFHPLSTVAFLASPFVVISMWYGTLDAFVFLGAILPPWIGIPLLLVKPQVGIGLVLFYAIESIFINRSLTQFTSRFFPSWIILALSISIYGTWFLGPTWTISQDWNASLWQFGQATATLSVILGVLLTVSAVKVHYKYSALSASPFFSPYVGLYSYSVVYTLFAKNPTAAILLTSACWFVVYLVGSR